MRTGRGTGVGRLASLTAAAVATTILLCITESVEPGHTAHASELRPPDQPAVAVATITAATTSQLADQRNASLRELATQVDAAAQQARLQAHEDAEQDQANAIKTEATRLTNLSRFTWPTKGGVSSGFGMRKHPILGYTRLHNGADIGGACGNPIYATQSGTVTKAGYSSSSGNNIRIDHGVIDGKQVETAYLHMSKLAARSGQQVDKGDVIGYVGTTGLSTACHLHLALYENGKGSNPLDYIERN